MSFTECSLCDQTFENQSKLDFHFRKVHLNVFFCPKCPKFSTLIMQRLKRHLIVDHAETLGTNDETFDLQGQDSIAALETSPRVSPQELRPPENKYVPICYQTHFSVTKDRDDDDGYEELQRFECEKCWFDTDKLPNLRQHLVERHSYEKQEIFDFIQSQLAKIRQNESISKKAKREISVKIANCESLSNSAYDFKISCGLCNFKTNTVVSMEYHLGHGFHFFPGSKIICWNCPYSPHDVQEVIEHGQSHQENFVLFRIRCEKCQFLTEDVQTFIAHFDAAHSKV